MRPVPRASLLVLCLVLPACAPPACSDHEDQAMLRDVETVATTDGRPARAAGDRLAAAGRRAIPLIETGLYTAEPDGRRRLVRVLERSGSDEALPILRHLAKHDPDPDVRDLAAKASRSRLP